MKISPIRRVLRILAAAAVAFAAADAGAVPPELFPEMGPTILANPDPVTLDIGRWPGRVYVTGAVSGLALWQSKPTTDNHAAYADIGNGMVFVQNAAGPVQFMANVGIYSIPTLAEPYTRARRLNSLLWGPLPQAYVKLVPTENFSVVVGRMPSLIGWENDFTFQNANIERGLLWNQETSINHGVQANWDIGRLEFSFSLNDGFFSRRYNWLTGAATYNIDDASWVTFSAGGAFRPSTIDTFRTPLAQNNSTIYNLTWNGTLGAWMLASSVQYTHVPNNSALKAAGFTHDASSFGVALNAAYAFGENWKLALRGEYITSSGNLADGAPELLTGGPGASAWSITLTPGWQSGIFFARPEISYVGLGRTSPGFAFGKDGNNKSQVRLLLEAGIVF